MIKISIITINFNNAEGLQRTLKSVVNQRFLAYEFVIIDGGSTDGSVDIIQQNTSKINFWVSEPDKGIYNAMNKGIRQAKGEYLLFLNSGDELFDSESLFNVAEQIHNEEIIYTDIVISNQQSSFKRQYPDKLSFSQLLFDSLPHHQATFIHKDLFEQFGFYDESYKICSDWAFFINAICKHNVSYKHLHLTLSIYHLDGISSSKKYEELIQKERRAILERDFPMYVSVYDELLASRLLMEHVQASRLLKLARRFGFLKHLLK